MTKDSDLDATVELLAKEDARQLLTAVEMLDDAVAEAEARERFTEADTLVLVRDRMLREYEQLSYREIADLRGSPLNTVRSQLFRARAALKSALETRTPDAQRTHHAGR